MLWLRSDADHDVARSTLVTETGETGELRPERRVTKERSAAAAGVGCRKVEGAGLVATTRRGAEAEAEGEGRPYEAQ